MTVASGIVEPAVGAITRLSAQAAVLVILVAAAQWALGNRISAKWRYILWSLPFLRLVIPWSIPAPFSVYTTLRIAGARAPLHCPYQRLTELVSVEPANVAGSVASGHNGSPWLWVAVIWLMGLAVLLGFSLLQVFRVRRQTRRYEVIADASILALLARCKRRLTIHTPVTLLAASDAAGPALLGYFRPRVLLPRRTLLPASRSHLRFVLLHELAHLKRRDILTGWAIHVLLSVHWFNPILWWAKRRCTADRELACDAEVLSVLGRDERRAYGHALLDQVMSGPFAARSPGLAGVLEGTTTVERRIAMIAEFRAPSLGSALAGLALLTVLGATALTDAQVGSTDAGSISSVARDVKPFPKSARELWPGAEPVTRPVGAQQVASLSTTTRPDASLEIDWLRITEDAGAASQTDIASDATNARKPPKTAEAPSTVSRSDSGAKPVSTAPAIRQAQRGEEQNTSKPDSGSTDLALDQGAILFASHRDFGQSPPSRIRQRLESTLAQRQRAPAGEGVVSNAVTVTPVIPENAVRTYNRAEHEVKSGATSIRPKKIRNKIGATWRSVRGVFGSDGTQSTVERGDRFDPAFARSIVGPAANGGNSSVMPTDEPAQGVAVTMSFTQASFRSLPKLEWGFANGSGARSSS
ncbi:MAG: M56 family metallopeptidase [Candidatus Hydrogenedentes bacterium]|nr:M56 family metallopeptidase [Candidatus Hydrogenedentota bacterium]